LAALYPALITAALTNSACAPEQATRAQSPPAAHPLDPLTAAEIASVTDVLGRAGRLPASVRVVTIELAEPDKLAVVGRPSGPLPARAARAVLYDWGNGATTELT